MRDLNPCKNCGAPAAEKTSGQQVYIECTNTEGLVNDDGTKVEPCGMRTPAFGASLDYGAWDRVATIWNSSTTKQEGARDNPLHYPQLKYYVGLYYLEDGAKYLCYRAYEGEKKPSWLIEQNFVAVSD